MRRHDLLRAWAAWCVLAFGIAAAAWATPIAPPAPVAPQANAGIGFDPRPGTRLPAGLMLRDAHDAPVDRAALLGSGRAIVLLPAWYRCQTLCGAAAHIAIEALADTGLPPHDWQLVLFSIDPHDTAADAAALQSVYRRYGHWARPAVFASAGEDDRIDGRPAGSGSVRLLVGTADQTAALARALGFEWRGDAGRGDLAHPVGLVVVTPDGRVSQALDGLHLDRAALRAALLRAREGRIGAETLTDRLLLACDALDPRSHGGATVAGVLHAVAGATLLALLALVLTLVHRRRMREADR